MAWIGALVAAGAAIYGDVSSQSGQQQTNQDNAAINQANINAAMTRQTQAEGFNAQQVQQQEQFQQNQVNQAEAYNTQMSDTAMQRRVSDLKAAGINPLLAVSQGGASTPQAPTMTGASANMSAAPAAASFPMQNPSSTMGNLGGQMSNAIQTYQMGANIDLMKAQTAKLNAESGTEIPAQVNYLSSMTGLNNQQAQVASLNAQQIAGKLKYDLGDGGNFALDWTKNWAQTGAASTNTDILRATKDALISAQQSDATAKALGLQELRNLNDVQQGKFGQIIAYLNAVLHPIATGAGAAGAVIP